jgi:hypothetical protein
VNRKLSLVVVTAVAALWLAPVRAETNEQRGKRVVDEALAAVGGARFQAMQDRVESGRAYSFYHENLTGLSQAKIYTRYLVRPEPPVVGFLGVRVREAFGKKQDDVILFTQDSGYELTFRGARPLPDTRVAQFKDSTLRNIFYILRQRMGEPGLVFDSRGRDFYNNRPIEIVDITDDNNQTVTVYFDQLNKLPIRQSFIRRDPLNNDRIEEVTVYAKYRDLGDGVMWPFDVRRERNGEKIFEMFSDRVTINQNLKDDLFTLPANMKILKKQP